MTKGDHEIIAMFDKYQFLTVEQMAWVLKRNVIAIRRRLMQLFQAGILNRAQEGDFCPYVYFVSPKGAQLAAELGELSLGNGRKIKDPRHIKHDLTVSEFHLALEKALHESRHVLQWAQRWKDIAELLGTHLEEKLIPDGAFILDDEAPSLLEVVRANETDYEDGESSLEKKLKAYDELQLKRVYVIMPTRKRVENFLGKVQDELSTRFWFTYRVLMNERILGPIWWTPHDFESREYSIFKPNS